MSDLDRAGRARGPLLKVEDLAVEFITEQGWVTVVDGVSFEVGHRETVGLIGESGCGKSVTAIAIMGLIGAPSGRITRGRILLEGQDLLALSERELTEIRGRRVAMVFQEPIAGMVPARHALPAGASSRRAASTRSWPVARNTRSWSVSGPVTRAVVCGPSISIFPEWADADARAVGA